METTIYYAVSVRLENGTQSTFAISYSNPDLYPLEDIVSSALGVYFGLRCELLRVTEICESDYDSYTIRITW
jgi:hypothetical protein